VAERVVGWRTVAERAQSVRVETWIIFALLMGTSYFARVLRFWSLVRPLHGTLAIGMGARIYLVHNALVTILPARIGEVALPILSHRWAALDWRQIVGVLTWWRLMDLTVFAAIVLVLLALGARVLLPLLGIGLLACTLPFIAFALRGWLAARLAARAAAGHEGRFAAFARRALEGVPARFRAVALDFVLSCIAWCSKLFAIAVVIAAMLRTLAISGPAADAAGNERLRALTAAVGGELGGGLPLPALAGVGPYDAAIFGVLASYHTPADLALSAALVAHGAVLASVIVTGMAAYVAHVGRAVQQEDR